MIYWVLDCCVLDNCNDENCDHEHYLNCISLLIKIKERDGICMDDTANILKEYLTHITSGTFLSKWWKYMMITIGKVHICSAHLPNKHIIKLANLHFDTDDIKYVGTAFNSPDKKLVTFDSDYHMEIVDYLDANCNISVVHPINCYNNNP